jgi:hypothetical protein
MNTPVVSGKLRMKVGRVVLDVVRLEFFHANRHDFNAASIS